MFKIGDKVVCVAERPFDRPLHYGDQGVVVAFDRGDPGVDWGKDICGHTCDGAIGYGRASFGLWMREENIISAYDELLNIGDHVVCCVDHPGENESIHIGDTGTIVRISEGSDPTNIEVEWDFPVDGGHNCHGNAKFGQGWIVGYSEIKSAKEQIKELDGSDMAELAGLIGCEFDV